MTPLPHNVAHAPLTGLHATPESQVPHTPPHESSPHDLPSHCFTQPSPSPSPSPSGLAPMMPSQAMSTNPVIVTETSRCNRLVGQRNARLVNGRNLENIIIWPSVGSALTWRAPRVSVIGTVAWSQVFA